MNEFAEVMSKRTDVDLIKILNSNEGDYLPAAIEAAKQEFDKRGLSKEQVTIAEKEIAVKQAYMENRAAEPLSSNWKVICCLFPGFAALFIAGTFKADGYDRKSKEVFRWTLYGVGFYVGFIIIMEILNRTLY